VKLPNLDLKLGIKPKAGNLLFGKREREGKGEREVRSKLGTATGNFFSSKRDGERYG
jgi:hypothetical protein